MSRDPAVRQISQLTARLTQTSGGNILPEELRLRRYPGLPQPLADDIHSHQATVSALKEVVETLLRARGAVSDSAITLGELEKLGLIRILPNDLVTSPVWEALSNWRSKSPDDDWVPATDDQWVGDADQHPQGVALGIPTGDPDDPGIEGVVAANQSAGQGIAIVGYGDGDTRAASSLGPLANRPVEVSGQPVLLMGPTFVETQNALLEDHYVLIGQSTQLLDGRHVAPLYIGPTYVPQLSETATDPNDYALDGAGTLVDVVTLNLTTGPYLLGQTTFTYEVRLSEESAQARAAFFDVEIWANIAGSGLQFIFRDEYTLAGQAQNFAYSTPVDSNELNSGDQIVMRVSAIESHPQSDPWVRGSVRASMLSVRQG